MTFLRLILVGSSYHQLPPRICGSSATTNYRRRLILFQASGILRRKYDLKRKLLRQQESNGESALKVDKTRAVVKDLHSRIRVAIHRIDSIAKKIEDLRDGELQPQLEELIGGSEVLSVVARPSNQLKIKFLEAKSRAHRLGQTEAVNIYVFCAKGTSDESRWQKLNRSLFQVPSVMNRKHAALPGIMVETISDLENSGGAAERNEESVVNLGTNGEVSADLTIKESCCCNQDPWPRGEYHNPSKMMWISKAEYDESGPAVHRKCF